MPQNQNSKQTHLKNSQEQLETKVVFYIQVYGERSELLECLKSLFKSYPKAEVIICFDGDPWPKESINHLKPNPNIRWYEGQRLFDVKHGGEICQRMFSLFLETEGDVFIKIDADTHIRRPLRYLPNRDEIYIGGTPNSKMSDQALQGGCIIFSRKYAETVFNSQLFLDPALKPPLLAWADGSESRKKRAHVFKLTSHDWTIAYVNRKLNINISIHPEVLSKWEAIPLKMFREFYRKAIVHPRQSSLTGPLNFRNILKLLKKRFVKKT
jgi:hypothetical protein